MKFETVEIKGRSPACDGGKGALGHPKVYLDMGQDTQVKCKYCDRIFVLDKSAISSSH